MIIIVSIDDDLHALAIQAELRRRGYECGIVATDTLSGTESIDVKLEAAGAAHMSLITTEGERVDVSSISAIWLRRPKALQKNTAHGLEEIHVNLINSDILAALNGGLQCAFSGVWLSHPRATERASNKIVQLSTAARCGLRTPNTIVSQNPNTIRAFFAAHSKRIIVKPVAGTPGPILLTQLVREEHFDELSSFRSAPAIYQECIPGTRHIRLNCFGNRSYACSIDSPRLDWRPDLSVPVNHWKVPRNLHEAVGRVLSELGLEMGIFDFKETPSGDLVFFEVNPQGQFLFLEGLADEPLIEAFSDFVIARISCR